MPPQAEVREVHIIYQILSHRWGQGMPCVLDGGSPGHEAFVGLVPEQGVSASQSKTYGMSAK